MSNIPLPQVSHPTEPTTPTRTRSFVGDVEIDVDEEYYENTPLLSPVNPVDADILFTMALDKELNRVVSFYREKEAEICDDVQEFEVDMSYLDSGQYMRRHSVASGLYNQRGMLSDGDVEERRANSDGEDGARGGASSWTNESSSAPSHPSQSIPVPGNLNTRHRSVSNGNSQAGTPTSVSASPRSGRPQRFRAKSDSYAEWTEPIPRGPSSAPESTRTSEASRTAVRPLSRRNSHHAVSEYASSIWDARSYKGHRQRFRRRVISLYVSLRELQKYVELNHTGFQKILKKYDKVTGRKLSHSYSTSKLDKAYPFLEETMDLLSRKTDRVILHYARICTKNKPGEAKRELDLNLRDHLVWERNTVWRDLVALERTRGNMAVKAITRKEDITSYPWAIRLFGKTVLVIDIPQNHIINALKIVLCLAVGTMAMLVPTSLPPEAQRCLAVLSFASALWATEVSDLFGFLPTWAYNYATDTA